MEAMWSYNRCPSSFNTHVPCGSHVTLSVMHVRSLVLHSSPGISEQKRYCSHSITELYLTCIWVAIWEDISCMASVAVIDRTLIYIKSNLGLGYLLMGYCLTQIWHNIILSPPVFFFPAFVNQKNKQLSAFYLRLTCLVLLTEHCLIMQACKQQLVIGQMAGKFQVLTGKSLIW